MLHIFHRVVEDRRNFTEGLFFFHNNFLLCDIGCYRRSFGATATNVLNDYEETLIVQDTTFNFLPQNLFSIQVKLIIVTGLRFCALFYAK